MKRSLSKLEQRAEHLVTRENFNKFMEKCWERVCGGPGALESKQHVKKSYIVCDNLRDAIEELLDVNNYNFMLYLKIKHFPQYLKHEIKRSDYRDHPPKRRQP